MRKFSSYGPINTSSHYYVPREHLIEYACKQLLRENPEGGHYITVWAPRQCGKTWIMIHALWRLMKDERFDVLKLDLEHLKMINDVDYIAKNIAETITGYLNIKDISINRMDEFDTLFKRGVMNKPLILIMDEFDALAEDAISGIAGVFRNIYNKRQRDSNPTSEKEYLLHGVALIGVRSVLGIENLRGSPFNVQRSLHIPNLTYEEVSSMFRWYERESGQKVEQDVIDRVYDETRGQPGLVSWFGELLTEGFEYFKPDHSKPLTMDDFEEVYAAAIQVLPNNNILNIISKAKQYPYRHLVMELFRTHEKVEFRFDEPQFNFLYMNGVVDVEKEDRTYFAKFPCPFVQKRLFNYFSFELFRYMGAIFEPFEDLSHIYTDDGLNIRNLLHRYEKHLQKNREWMFKNAPRRSDMRVYEAVFHFNLYEYLNRFLANKKADVWPEFPTGNGKIDLFIRFRDKTYGIEVKSYTDDSDFRDAIWQAARYAASLNMNKIHLIEFVEYINAEQRQKYEADYTDESTGIIVAAVFVATGA